jgi:hypothetical protein
VFTPSGHRHGPECDLLAHKAGYFLFSADYTGILKNNIIIRNWKIPSVFLYLKDPTSFASRSGYPFIGVVHDYEIKKGLDKFQEVIEKWRSTGIKNFVSMRDFTASLCIEVDAYYYAAESLMKIILTKPNYTTADIQTPDLRGAELHLRIVTPKGMVPVKNSILVSGATLVSSQFQNHNGDFGICLRLDNDPVAKITLPLKPINLEK